MMSLLLILLIIIIIIIIIIISVFSVTSYEIRKRHNCIHGQLNHTKLLTQLQDYTKIEKEISWKRQKSSSSFINNNVVQVIGPIRIFVDTSLLNYGEDGQTCYNIGDQVWISSSNQPLPLSPISCTSTIVDNCLLSCTTEYVVSSDMKNYLISLMSSTVQIWSELLYVDRLSSPLVIPSHVSYCGDVSLPINSTYQNSATTPAQNADLVIFVTARLTTGIILAYASACYLDSSTNRPLAGRINFSPNSIFSTEYSENSDAFIEEQYIAVHETTHILLFSPSLFPLFANGPLSLKTISYQGAAITVVASENVVNYTRNFFGCNSLLGASLEDGGGSGTAGTHWEKRLFFDDYITGEASLDPKISPITIALAVDSGWYYQAATATNYIQSMSWGSNMGCDFVNGNCNSTTWQNADGSYYSSSNNVEACLPGNRGKGMSLLETFNSNLPSNYQHFSSPNYGGTDNLADYCPIFQPYCICGYKSTCSTDLSTSTIYAEAFGEGTMCVMSTVRQKSYQALSNERPSCFPVVCLGFSQPMIKAGNIYYNCSSQAGVTISTPNDVSYVGKIQCPNDLEDLCGEYSEYVNNWPIIYSVTPNSISSVGGSIVTVAGLFFNSISSVMIGGENCNIVKQTQKVVICKSGAYDSLMLQISGSNKGSDSSLYIVDESGKTSLYNGIFQIREVQLSNQIFKVMRAKLYYLVSGGMIFVLFLILCCCYVKKKREKNLLDRVILVKNGNEVFEIVNDIDNIKDNDENNFKNLNNNVLIRNDGNDFRRGSIQGERRASVFYVIQNENNNNNNKNSVVQTVLPDRRQSIMINGNQSNVGEFLLSNGNGRRSSVSINSTHYINSNNSNEIRRNSVMINGDNSNARRGSVSINTPYYSNDNETRRGSVMINSGGGGGGVNGNVRRNNIAISNGQEIIVNPYDLRRGSVSQGTGGNTQTLNSTISNMNSLHNNNSNNKGTGSNNRNPTNQLHAKNRISALRNENGDDQLQKNSKSSHNNNSNNNNNNNNNNGSRHSISYQSVYNNSNQENNGNIQTILLDDDPMIANENHNLRGTANITTLHSPA